MKKFFIFLLILFFLMPIGLASEDMNGESGVIGEFQIPDLPDSPDKFTSVIIYKEITAYNPEQCVVNAPEITFNYTISSGDSGKNIYDSLSKHLSQTSSHVVTKSGIGNPTITGTSLGTLAITTSNQLNASSEGTSNRFPLMVDLSSVDFSTSGSGVYRYVINETTTESVKNSSGIKEGEVANTLYLDVYVNGSGNIYGYVLFTYNIDIDGREDNVDITAGKTEGFVGNQPNHGQYTLANASIADKYYTFNLSIKKIVENDNFISDITHHEFPFTLTLTNADVTTNILPIMLFSDNGTQFDTSALHVHQNSLAPAPITTIWNPTISHNTVVKYNGIPCGTSVEIFEQNDVSSTSYTAISNGADVEATEKTIFTNELSETAIVNCSTFLTSATETHNIVFTNILLQISPTGVILRVVPYVLIFGAGLTLLIIATHRNKEKEED